MSVADPFKFHDAFPQCATPGYNSAWAGAVDNLTLEQAMRTFWLLEQLEFDVSGTTALGSFSGYVNLNKGSGTGCLARIEDYYYESYGSAWMGPYTMGTPTIPAPKARVCMPARDFLSDGIMLVAQYRFSDASSPIGDWESGAQWFITLAPSAAYSGKWLVAPSFELRAFYRIDANESYGFQILNGGASLGYDQFYDIDLGDFSLPLWGKAWANMSDGGDPPTYPKTYGSLSMTTTPSFFTFA